MNEITASYLEQLKSSYFLSKVDNKAKRLVGRNDAVERLAEYLQDLCPCVMLVDQSQAKCHDFLHECEIDFNCIAEAMIRKLDPIRIVQ